MPWCVRWWTEAGIRRFENEFWKRQRVEGRVRKKPKVTGTNKTKGRKLGFYNEFKESFYVQTTSIPFSKLNRFLPWVWKFKVHNSGLQTGLWTCKWWIRSWGEEEESKRWKQGKKLDIQGRRKYMEIKRAGRKEKECHLVFPWHHISQSLTLCQVLKQRIKGILKSIKFSPCP